jgi:hypothetical protein
LKEYAGTLISLAKGDLELAEFACDISPNQAAFHAQQCVEKSVKAVAFELGQFKSEGEFRPIAKLAGHNSLYSCLQVVKASILKSIAMAHKEQDRVKEEAGKKFGWNQKALSASIGWASRRALAHFFDSEFGKLEKKAKRKRNKKGLWARTLNPEFDPANENKGGTEVKISLPLRPFIWLYKWSMRHMGVKGKSIHQFDDLSTMPENPTEFIDGLLEELRTKGNKDVIQTIENTRSLIVQAVGPKGEMLHWTEQVTLWSAAFDTHAVIGRYPTTKQLLVYMSHKEGVRNLVSKARGLLEISSEVIALPKTG